MMTGRRKGTEFNSLGELANDLEHVTEGGHEA